jgi:hypothetical protein
MIDLQIDGRQLDQLVLNLAATEDQARKALRSTLSKMAAWVRAQSVKGLSKELAIMQRVVRRRLKAAKFRESKDGGMAKVWYGLNPVDLIWLNAKQNSKGVTAQGGRTVAGGFIATMKNGHRGVFKRRDKARLRIDEQAASIQTPAEKYIADAAIFSARFEAQFWKTFEHELKWRTQ